MRLRTERRPLLHGRQFVERDQPVLRDRRRIPAVDADRDAVAERARIDRDHAVPALVLGTGGVVRDDQLDVPLGPDLGLLLLGVLLAQRAPQLVGEEFLPAGADGQPAQHPDREGHRIAGVDRGRPDAGGDLVEELVGRAVFLADEILRNGERVEARRAALIAVPAVRRQVEARRRADLVAGGPDLELDLAELFLVVAGQRIVEDAGVDDALDRVDVEPGRHGDAGDVRECSPDLLHDVVALVGREGFARHRAGGDADRDRQLELRALLLDALPEDLGGGAERIVRIEAGHHLRLRRSPRRRRRHEAGNRQAKGSFRQRARSHLGSVLMGSSLASEGGPILVPPRLRCRTLRSSPG